MSLQFGEGKKIGVASKIVLKIGRDETLLIAADQTWRELVLTEQKRNELKCADHGLIVTNGSNDRFDNICDDTVSRKR